MHFTYIPPSAIASPYRYEGPADRDASYYTTFGDNQLLLDISKLFIDTFVQRGDARYIEGSDGCAAVTMDGKHVFEAALQCDLATREPIGVLFYIDDDIVDRAHNTYGRIDHEIYESDELWFRVGHNTDATHVDPELVRYRKHFADLVDRIDGWKSTIVRFNEYEDPDFD